MLLLTKRGVDQLVAALGDEPPDPALLGLPQRTTRSRSRMLLKLQQPQRIEGAAGLRRARAYGTETLCHLAYHLVTGTLNLGWAFFGTGVPSRARTLRTRTPRTRACAPRSRAPAPREGSATTPGPHPSLPSPLCPGDVLCRKASARLVWSGATSEDKLCDRVLIAFVMMLKYMVLVAFISNASTFAQLLDPRGQPVA